MTCMGLLRAIGDICDGYICEAGGWRPSGIRKKRRRAPLKAGLVASISISAISVCAAAWLYRTSRRRRDMAA